MPRPHRLIVPGVPHHITQRGNYRQTVFFRNADRQFYLELLSEFLPHYGVALEGYCLMDNHVHLLAIPHDPKGLSRALQRIHSDYARAIHLRLRRMGHLWQARFHSTPLVDEKHSWDAALYVERNPVRAGLSRANSAWIRSGASRNFSRFSCNSTTFLIASTMTPISTTTAMPLNAALNAAPTPGIDEMKPRMRRGM